MKRITISIPDDVAEAAERAVAAGWFASTSAFFSATARKGMAWAESRATLDEMLAAAEAAGTITDEDRAAAAEFAADVTRAAADRLGGAA
ncbi:hypothetical protein [Nocardia sp. NPDC050710]|uniref:hypothetical protein n=1 Tax=Nocardia sp. NPDC050710 TaxID=3157220 RepID=UPI0033FE589F